MSDTKTNVTELATALGMLGIGKSTISASQLPPIVGVDLSAWGSVVLAASGGLHSGLFDVAHGNGVHFLNSVDGLRGRAPRIVQWKGPHKAVGDEAAPVDLRIDHVYLVSCKYLSKVLHNASPGAVFDRVLTGGQGQRRGSDWFVEVAPAEYQDYYERAIEVLGKTGFPPRVTDLQKTHRTNLKALGRSSSPALDLAAAQFYARVAETSASRWWSSIQAETADHRRILWRLLRIGSAPYFVLGAATECPLRLRVATPWDWSQRYDLRSFVVAPGQGGQAIVTWAATYDDRLTSVRGSVEGHIEIRWSHGKFCGPPEAKVYLDTPIMNVPGYFQL